jgi:hypothetical protein
MPCFEDEEITRALSAATASLLELVGLKLTSGHVTSIDFRVVTPFFWQIIQRKDG